MESFIIRIIQKMLLQTDLGPILSSLRTVESITSGTHSSVLPAVCFYLLTSSCLQSFSASSSYFSAGLPTSLVPSGLFSNTFFFTLN
jgi:hypothetical protein